MHYRQIRHVLAMLASASLLCAQQPTLMAHTSIRGITLLPQDEKANVVSAIRNCG